MKHFYFPFGRKALLPFLLFTALAGTDCFAQRSFTVHGKVLDNVKKSPVEGAYVFLRNSSVGTITNRDGSFSLVIPGSVTAPELGISCMGYENKSIKNPGTGEKSLTVLLRAKTFNLEEVVIVPDTFLQGLLARAFRNIRVNYPESPVSSETFYRESMFGLPDSDLVYFNEGLFKVYTGSYQENPDVQAKLLKSIKHVTGSLDSSLSITNWNSGVFNFEFSDFVLLKREFINPRHFKDYEYTLRRITVFNNDSVYQIEFKPKTARAKFKGTLYIDAVSLAYIAGFYSFTEPYLQEGMSGRHRGARLSRDITTYYKKVGDKWVMFNFKYETSFFDKKVGRKLCKTAEALNTVKKFNATDETIPFEERYSGVFLHQAQSFDSASWDSTTTLVHDSAFTFRSDGSRIASLDSSYRKAKKTESQAGDRRRRRINLLSRFSAGADLLYTGYSNNISALRIGTGENQATVSPDTERSRDYVLSVKYYYALNKRWRLAYSAVLSSLTRGSYFSWSELGISYRRNIRKKHRPVFLVSELFFSRAAFGPGINPEGPVTVGGTTLEASDGDMYLLSRVLSCKYNTMLLLPLTRSLKLGLHCSLQFPVYYSNLIFQDTAKGFWSSLFGKTQLVQLSEDDTSPVFTGQERNSFFNIRFISFGAGIYWGGN
jgi:hypothetical protein